MSETIIKMTDGVIRQQKNTILKNVNIEIQSGEFVYLIGKVGSGKSSFLKTLYAELPLEYGAAEVAGFQLKKIRKSQIPLLRRKCGIVFQDFKLLTDRNVFQNLEFVLRATGWKNKKAIRERIETVLSKVDMTDKWTKMPHELSGGEQQRIVLARALLNAPPLILADEPTGNIDPETSYRLIELLKEICETGKTIIIATHQYDLIEKYPGRVFCFENGELSERTKATACECADETAPLSEDTEVTPDTEDTATEEAAPEVPEVSETEAAVKSDEKPVAEEQTPETDALAAEEPSAPEITDERDLLSMIGKLDYPEITAFDYEIATNPLRNNQSAPATPEREVSAPTEEEKTESSPAATGEEKKNNTPPPLELELID